MINFSSHMMCETTTELQYSRLHSRAENILPTFNTFLQNIASLVKDTKILSNIKKFSSFQSKLRRKGSIKDVQDILRGAILTETQIEAAEIAYSLKNNELTREWERKDLYDAWHVKVFMPGGGDGMICEIQIMTKKMWDYKEAAHYQYIRTREGEKDHSVERFANQTYKIGTMAQ